MGVLPKVLSFFGDTKQWCSGGNSIFIELYCNCLDMYKHRLFCLNGHHVGCFFFNSLKFFSRSLWWDILKCVSSEQYYDTCFTKCIYYTNLMWSQQITGNWFTYSYLIVATSNSSLIIILPIIVYIIFCSIWSSYLTSHVFICLDL